jgi:arylsulfatase A-like enzyme
MLLAAEGELEQALEEFRTAMRANPSHLEAHYQALVMAERLDDEAAARTARDGFSRLYRERLEAGGALSALPSSADDARVYRGVSFEARRAVEETTFTRSYPAGATLELAFRAPANDEASFTAAPEGGESFSVVHAGQLHEAVWVPHVLELPGGEGEVEVEFRVEAASAFARLTGGDPPEDAAIAEPRVLAPAETRSSDRRPNVLVFSLDTLRADRVGAYGHERDTTPFVDELAAGGALFRRAQAPSNWTLPSHYSMFSGLTPISHGVMPDLGDVRGYIHPDRQLAVRGSGREVMLAERLEEAGYRTSAITENGWVSARFGFDQGFQIYRSAAAGSLPGTLAGTLAELELAGERGPWFLFVHTYAPHQPYHAPRALRTRWAAADHVGFAWPEARVPIDDYNRFRNRWFLPTPSDVTTFFDLYDGQTAWADSLVGDVVGWLEARGLLEQTLIVVTSDHGEEIFERGNFDHGDTLFEEVTHVPLVIHAPGLVPAGVSVDGAVSLVDLPATILDLLGLGDVHGQGRTLMPLILGDEPSGQRVVHAQATGHGGEPLYAVWRGSRKYVLRETDEGPVQWCFDLASDPRERRNLLGMPSCDEAGFRELLDEHRASAAEIREALGVGEGAVDAETLERLKSLGYAQ